MTGARRTIGGLAVLLALGMLCLTPASAKPKKTTTDTTSTTTESAQFLGGSDPTNTPVTDDDLLLAAYAGDVTVADLQLATVEANEVATGSGVVVAVLDGGFNLAHPDISYAVSMHAYDAIDDDFDPNDVESADPAFAGHGTFVAGMVLRAAPLATILPIRIRDGNGVGTNEAVVTGIQYALAHGVDVINLSVQLSQAKMKSVSRVLQQAVDAGVLVVVSAGNDGLSELDDLGWMWETLPVGAVDDTNAIAWFSNYSTDVSARMIFAPGVELEGPIGAPEDDSRGRWSGTSFAAGLVSGAAALAYELNPDASVEAIREILVTSVDPVTLPDGSQHPHAGCVDLAKVVSR
jgi:subtilisin family serine protease